MKRYTIEQKFKSAAAFLVILILFPYIVSVFVNGVDPEETTNENFYIRVKASEEEEADGIAEVEWNEYLTGVLAKDVPADTETEALKAQAVLVRTQISRALQRSTQAEETENQKSDRTGNVSDVILEIEVQGGAQIKEKVPECVSIFILPPSVQILEHRLRSRNTETEDAIQKRLLTAKEEIRQAYSVVITA